MNDSVNTPLRHTSIHTIREDLRALWASESMSDEAVIRARTHNLVVCTTDSLSTEETTRWVIESTAERPGRVIVIDVDPNRSQGMDAWVTTYCRTVGRLQVCGELITLTIGPGRQEEVYSTVVSLLAPELPVYLWWLGTPDPADHLFSHLAAAADRVLLDSETFEDSTAGLLGLAALQADYKVSDLNWARLTQWRKLMAQLWDVRDLRPALDAIRTLDVHHVSNEGSRNSSRALLLIGWLASRLGWQIDSVVRGATGSYTILWHSGSWEGKAETLETAMPELLPGEIARIFIQAGERAPFVMPRLELMPQLGVVETRLNDGSHAGGKYSTLFKQRRTPDALAEELDVGYDPSYSGAVQSVATILNLASKHKGH